MSKVTVHYKTNICRNNTFCVDSGARVSDLINAFFDDACVDDREITHYRFAVNGMPVNMDDCVDTLSVNATDDLYLEYYPNYCQLCAGENIRRQHYESFQIA